MPAGSKSTCSNAHRIGQSTFQTSLPSFWVARLVTPVNPHDWQVYDEVGRLVVVRRDVRGVAPALAAVRLEREPLEPGAGRGVDVLVVGDRVGELLGLLLGLGHPLLGAVLREHRVDVVAVAYGVQHLLAVDPGRVALGLGDLLHVHAELVQGVAQRRLEVLGPGRVALPRVGDGARAAGRCGRPRTGRRPPAPCGTGRSRPRRAGGARARRAAAARRRRSGR